MPHQEHKRFELNASFRITVGQAGGQKFLHLGLSQREDLNRVDFRSLDCLGRIRLDLVRTMKKSERSLEMLELFSSRHIFIRPRLSK
jgi:hypothetical protein